jgi:hypothetical protein
MQRNSGIIDHGLDHSLHLCITIGGLTMNVFELNNGFCA